MTAQRIQLSRRKGWRKPDGAVSVARPHQYGNPFRIGVRIPVFWDTGTGNIEAETRAEAVAYFRDWMNGVVDIPDTARPDVASLMGHNLACWCPLDEPCHADVLLELANRSVQLRRNEGTEK